MGPSNPKLPHILYDQTQFTAVYWIDPKSLWMNNEVYRRMGEISGYAPDTWFNYTQNLPESFWFGAYDEAAIKQEAETGFKNFSDKKFFQTFEGAVEKSYQKTALIKEDYFKEFYGRERAAVEETPEQVAAFLEKVREVDTFILAYYVLTQPQRFYKFEAELKKETLNQDLELVATTGKSLTYTSRLRKAILDYADLALPSPEQHHLLLEAVNKLGFLNWGLFGGDLIDNNYIDVEIKKLVSDKSSWQEEKHQLDTLAANIEKRESLVAANQSQPYVLADIMGQVAVLRFDLQTCTLSILNYAENLLKEVAAKNNLTEAELKSYEFEEILELLRNNKKIPVELLVKRQQGYLRIYRHDGITTYLGEEAHREIAALLEFRKKEISEASTLHGTVASWPDKNIESLRGKALVITTAFGADQIVQAMKPGEILVATQTHPNLVPKMKEALAIVTDEGGITCHAAIVSRELNKPCIIGTRLASKIIKTGDIITLNLKTGEITLP